MSLTRRLVLTVVSLVVAVSLLVAGAATLLMRDYLTDRLDAQLSQAMDRASDEARGTPFGPPQAVGGPTGRPDVACGERPRPPLGQAASSLTAVFTSDCRSGVQITQRGRLRLLSSTTLDVLAGVEADETPRTVDLPALGSVRVAATTTSDGTTVVQGLPTGSLDATLGRLLWWEALRTVLGAAAAAAVGVALVRRQLRPLRQVAATAHEVTTLPLDSGQVGRTVRVPDPLTDPATEVGQVGEALNRLLGHVEQALDARHESEQQVRQFLADASHELRTPLSTLRGYAELGRRTGTDQLTKVEEEAERMSALVDDMLLLARLDSGRPLEREPVDLVLLVAEAVTDAQVVDGERSWRLELPDAPVEVQGDARRLHQAVTNLLRNATRHTPPGTVVTAGVRTSDGGDVVLHVHDDGPGIAPDLLPVVFERFTRGDTSRTRASGGAGLGTSLVRAIARAHEGDVEVESRPGSTTFTVTLPRV